MTCNTWLTAGLAGSLYCALIQQWAVTYLRWSIVGFLSRRPRFSSSVLRVRLVVVSVTFGRLDFNPAALSCQLSFYHCSILVCLEGWCNGGRTANGVSRPTLTSVKRYVPNVHGIGVTRCEAHCADRR